MLAFAFFLSAITLLSFSAARISEKADSSVQSAAERHALSYSALSIDEAGSSLSGAEASRPIAGIPSQNGTAISSSRIFGISEKMFHRISIDSEGKFYVQKSNTEPV